MLIETRDGGREPKVLRAPLEAAARRGGRRRRRGAARGVVRALRQELCRAAATAERVAVRRRDEAAAVAVLHAVAVLSDRAVGLTRARCCGAALLAFVVDSSGIAVIRGATVCAIRGTAHWHVGVLPNSACAVCATICFAVGTGVRCVVWVQAIELRVRVDLCRLSRETQITAD
eukprot:SAG11_NODE_3259_length_2573_cov_1.385206_3_plen_174_part_00